MSSPMIWNGVAISDSGKMASESISTMVKTERSTASPDEVAGFEMSRPMDS